MNAMNQTMRWMVLLAVGALLACGTKEEGKANPSASTKPTPSPAQEQAIPIDPKEVEPTKPAPTPAVAPLPGTVATAEPGLRGVDAYDTISAEAATAMREQGYTFAARYLRHSENTKANHITRTEAEAILGAGLGLLLVQEGRGWHQTVPTAALGTSDGTLTVQEATALGYPSDAVVFLDVESVVAEAARPEDVIAFATAWHDAVKGSFVPGYYVGPGGKLDAAQLGALPFQHFWKSGTDVPAPAGRGYQLTQHRYEERGKNVVGGVGIDYDVTQNDDRGGALRWLAPPS